MQALAELDDNPLGANLAIQANQTSQYENIARFLQEKRDMLHHKPQSLMKLIIIVIKKRLIP